MKGKEREGEDGQDKQGTLKMLQDDIAANANDLYVEESKRQVQAVDSGQLNSFRGTESESLLNFKVFHCSSQDAAHTVSELTANARDPNNLTGWQSQRFCIYPQELIVQFQGGVHIT